ncbi:VOC family protein [Radicibacter daui]|uniref:VOC family protein n=1 Tax=Radicibacter daui TaxID=3064829 RepID=UPI004046BD05
MLAARAILETALYVDDLEAAERFYRDVFGLEVITRVPGRHVFFRCGPQVLLIFIPEVTSQPGVAGSIPLHGAKGPGHICFRAQDGAEFDAWRAQIVAAGVTVEHDHVWPNGARSVYVRDPAGNSVEVAEAALWGLG